MKYLIPLKFTCANCGQPSEVSYYAVDRLETGASVRCDECGKITMLMLLTTEQYANVNQISKEELE